MINNKTDLSKFCKAVQTSITNIGSSIKLASVRERVAQSLSYNSVNDLLANLPVLLTDDFWNFLPNSFKENHDIDFTIPPWQLPFPELFPLTETERGLIWRKFCQSINATEDASEFIDGTEIRPDGTGGWYFKYEIPHIAYDSDEIKAKEDPVIEKEGDEYTLFELHLRCISTDTPNRNWGTHSNEYSDMPHMTLSGFADRLGIDIHKLPEAALNIQTEYPIDGEDSDSLVDNFSYKDNPLELIEKLIKGMPLIGQIEGHEEYLYELGFIQMFFLADGNKEPVDPAAFVFGNYLVSIVNKFKTIIPPSMLEADNKTIMSEDNRNGKGNRKPASYQQERKVCRLTRDIHDDIFNAILSFEMMIELCVNNKEFPLLNFTKRRLDEDDEINLEISIQYLDNMFVIFAMPLTYIIPMGNNIADGFVGAISTLIANIKGAGATAKVRAIGGEIVSDNINSDTVISVIEHRGTQLSNIKSVFGDYKGYIKPDKVSNWLHSIGVTQLNANAFNSSYTGDWVYLSIAGFNRTGQRICILGITFYTHSEQDSWDKWLKSFHDSFGSKIHINETYEFSWKIESHDREDFNPPYSIPEPPISSRPKLGVGWFAFYDGHLKGNVPLVLPDSINKLIFTGRDLSELPPFRITTLIAVPDGRNAFEFFNEAMEYAGEVTLSDDESWEYFMIKIFEHIIENMTPISQLHSFLLIEGGDAALQNISNNYLPIKRRNSSKSILNSTEINEDNFNTNYSDGALKEISKILNIEGTKGVNFASSGNPYNLPSHLLTNRGSR